VYVQSVGDSLYVASARLGVEITAVVEAVDVDAGFADLLSHVEQIGHRRHRRGLAGAGGRCPPLWGWSS
jgi:hypothetical protein